MHSFRSMPHLVFALAALALALFVIIMGARPSSLYAETWRAHAPAAAGQRGISAP
jgi:hypothetical protein